jgi:ASPIC/UnbV protein
MFRAASGQAHWRLGRLYQVRQRDVDARRVKAGSSYLGQNDTRVHFGLGMAPRADRLEVRWPAGRSETFQQVQAGAIVTIVEGEGITRRVAFRQ